MQRKKALALEEAEALTIETAQDKLQRAIRALHAQEAEEIASLRASFKQDMAREMALQTDAIAVVTAKVCWGS